MKIRILLFSILITILVSGCLPLEYIPAYEQLRGLDLRPYAEKNFLITPYAYNGLYTSVGIIDYKLMPVAILKTVNKYDPNQGTSQYKKWEIDTVDTQEALDKIYMRCIDMGANALVDFEILETEDYYSGIAKPVVITGIRITGLAIRRDDLE